MRKTLGTIKMFEVAFRSKIIKVSQSPNLVPLIIRSITFPVQFIVSIAVWRIIFSSASRDSIQGLLVITSLSFLSTVFLLGSHTNLGNFTIDGSIYANRQLMFSLLCPLILILLFVPIILLFESQILTFLLIPASDKIVLTLLILLVGFLAPSAAFQSVLVAKDESAYVASTPIVGSIFSYIVIKVMIMSNHLSMAYLYLCLMTPGIVSAILLGIRAVRYLKPAKLTFKLHDLKNYVNAGSLLISIAAPFAFQLDRVLISHLGTIEDSMKAAPVNRIVNSVFLILSSAGMAFWPHIRMKSEKHVISKFTFQSILAAVPFSIGVFLFGSRIVQYATNNLNSLSFPECTMVAIYILIYSSTIVTSIAFSDKAGQMRVFLLMMLSTLGTIVFGVVLIPNLGILGYYLGASISISLFLSVPLLITSRKISFSGKYGKHA